MTHLRISYANIEHGGKTVAGYSAYSGDGGPFDYNRITGMVHDQDFPDVFVVGFADLGARDHRPGLRFSGADMSATAVEARRSLVSVGVRWSE